MDYKKYIISKGGQELGLLWSDIEEYLLPPSEHKKFAEFMGGQTVCCLGKENIVYTGDFERFIKGLLNPKETDGSQKCTCKDFKINNKCYWHGNAIL